MLDGIDDTTVLLWAARETGVLAALTEDADTPAEVAATAGVTERAARVLVDRLAAEGFLEEVAGDYEPTNRALGFLTKTDVRSIGPYPHRMDVFGMATALPETIERGDPPARPDDWTVDRLGARAATDDATVRAVVTAALRPVPDADRVVDVGGAPGTFAREFAARGCDVTLLDGAEAIEHSRALLASEPVDAPDGGSVTVREGDPDDVADLAGADLVFAADLARRRGADDNRAFLSAAREAVSPGGAAVLVDVLGGRSAAATRAAVETLATTDDGEPYPADRYREWFEAAGFDPVRVRDVPGTDRHAVVGRWPD